MPTKKRAPVHPLFNRPKMAKRLASVGFEALAQEVQARSALAWERQLEMARQFNRSFIGMLSELAGQRDVDEIITKWSPRTRHRPVTKLPRPPAPPDEPEEFILPLGARVTPPFDYAGVLHAGADESTGQLAFIVESLGNDDYDESACASVGIFLAPPLDGRLTVWSNPSHYEDWFDYAYFAAAHSDAFIGFWIGEYDQNGVFERALVDQRNKLWDDDSHLGSAENQGYGVTSLSAFCSVTAGHQYLVSVSIGGRASADKIAGGAAARSALNAVVPSITWELT